jgi:hypothetical protein
MAKKQATTDNQPINPPTEENFKDTVTETTEYKTTAEHPNVVYLYDVQAVQLEVYRAGVEGRKPNFEEFAENAVKAAGWDKKKCVPLAQAGPGEPLPTVTEQTPIRSEDLQPNGASPVSDPVLKGLANSDNDEDKKELDRLTNTKVDTPIEQQPEDQQGAKEQAIKDSAELSKEKGAAHLAASAKEGGVDLDTPPADRDTVAQKAKANLASEKPAKKVATPAKKATTKKAVSPRAKKAAAARKSGGK